MNKRFFLFLLILAAAGGGWYYWKQQNAETGAPEMPMAMMMAMQKPAVSIKEISIQKITQSISLPGRISAFGQAQIRPQVNGIITERLFEEGALVEKGQQLYQIDDKRYKAALASAEADLKSAQANVKSVQAKRNRYRSLVKIDAVSRQEYDDIRAELDQANASIAVTQAAIDVAQVNLDYTKVYAPISGRIGRSLITEGALATANQSQALAVITQLDQVYVDMQQSGSDVMRLRNIIADGAEIAVSLTIGEEGSIDAISYPEKGVLKFSEVTIDGTTGSVTLRAVMPNPKAMLLPGLFVRASLNLGEKEAMLVPQRSTTRTPDGKLSVYVLEQGNIVQPRILKTNGTYKDNWIVTEGLRTGQLIVSEGYQKVKPGSEVTPSMPGQEQTRQKQSGHKQMKTQE